VIHYHSQLWPNQTTRWRCQLFQLPRPLTAAPACLQSHRRAELKLKGSNSPNDLSYPHLTKLSGSCSDYISSSFCSSLNDIYSFNIHCNSVIQLVYSHNIFFTVLFSRTLTHHTLFFIVQRGRVQTVCVQHLHSTQYSFFVCDAAKKKKKEKVQRVY
jgi:hypothetical protein